MSKSAGASATAGGADRSAGAGNRDVLDPELEPDAKRLSKQGEGGGQTATQIIDILKAKFIIGGALNLGCGKLAPAGEALRRPDFVDLVKCLKRPHSCR